MKSHSRNCHCRRIRRRDCAFSRFLWTCSRCIANKYSRSRSRPGRLRRHLHDPNAPKRQPIDPYTREEVEVLLDTAYHSLPEWYPLLLCAVRTGLRLGELRALEWRDVDWRQRFIRVERNYVEGAFTTPKNGHCRNVDMSLQLRATLRLWRRHQRALWLQRGRPLPAIIFPSAHETPIDDSR